MLRDHEPIVIEEFNGLWRRGDEDSVPLDHFSDCENIQFIESGFETRDGIDILFGPTLPIVGNILRLYNYKLQNGESLIFLDSNGDIYHALLDGSLTLYGPVLHVTGMTDFGFTAFAGRAYITPYKTETNPNGENFQRGIQNEFLYVYKGDGSNARKAAGAGPISATALTAVVSAGVGFSDIGLHIFAVVFMHTVKFDMLSGKFPHPKI